MLIPEYNDADADIFDECAWIASDLAATSRRTSPRSTPDYKMRDVPASPP